MHSPLNVKRGESSLLEDGTCYINFRRVELRTPNTTLNPIASISKVGTFQIKPIKLYLHKRGQGM